MRAVIASANKGFAASSQRRGVTPLVLLLNRSGNISLKSFKRSAFNSSVCRAATPLTECDPTTARYAMRMRLPPASSISDIRAMRGSS